MSTPYLSPLDRLLALSLPQFGRYKPWPDYLAMGFAAEHVPELMRMVLDEELEAGDGDEPATYGPVHAWRTLGLLRAEQAVEPLMWRLETDDDWAKEEIPAVLGMIGPAAFEPLRATLARRSQDPEPWGAGAAASGLVEIAQRHPEMRDAAVASLSRQLRWWARHEPVLNTMLIHDLVELKAVEAAPLMEAAFAANAVDTMHDDDWEDVQVALGLLPERITPPPVWVRPGRLRSTPQIRIVSPEGDVRPGSGARAAARRKAQKAAKRKRR